MYFPDDAGCGEKGRSTVSISVIIPTLNAEKELPALLKMLRDQTLPADEILVVDSESADRTVSAAEETEGVRVLPVKRKDFDHGRTRDLALRNTSGEIIVFLTQDAIPADRQFMENLVRPLEQEDIAVVTGRQLPKKNATPMEKLVRTFNYPAESHIRSEADIGGMGIKAFFCSDVCAAYRRRTYEELGGFDYPLKTNEDMFFAARAIRNGYRVAYAADARVYHSHNFSLKEQYRRNKIQGYEIERHRALLGDVSKVSEGIRMVRFVSGRLLRQGRLVSFVHFGLDCFARLLGSQSGRRQALRENGTGENGKNQG